MPTNSAPLTPSPAPPPPDDIRATNGFHNWREAPSHFQKLNWLLAQFRPLVYLAWLILMGIGLKVAWPGERITALERAVEQLIRQHDTYVAGATAVARLQCFNEIYTDAQRAASGIDCDAVRRGDYLRGIRQQPPHGH